ncbi:MAG: glycosyltransferase family 4 protein [Elusimicrobia bacterium]|nr:glycosyltransferase family 4 protein [Elusimicrobiota bacterium]
MKIVYTIRNFELTNGNARLVWELSQRARGENHGVDIVAHRFPEKGKRFSAGKSPLPPDPRTSPDGSPRVLAGPLSTTGFKGDFPALNPYEKSMRARERESAGVNSGIGRHYVPQLPKIFGSWRARSFAWLSSRRAQSLKKEKGVVHGFGDSYRQDILTLGNIDWSYGSRIPGRSPSAAAVAIKAAALSDAQTAVITVVSAEMRRDLLKNFPVLKSEKVRVSYPGVDAKKFSPAKREAARQKLSEAYGIPREAFWIVFAAGGDFEKRNFGGIVKALERLKGEDWVFVVAGAKASAIVIDEKLRARTFFLGLLPDLSEVFPACDLMAYPAWYDEFALVCLEAMASGVPVVLSRTVGASEIFPRELDQSCVLKDPQDAVELAAKIDYWRKAPPAAKEIFSKVAAEYSWDRFYAGYRELYQEVADRGENA